MCLGIPGRIVEINDAEANLATVDVCGVRRRINISCIVDESRPALACLGDWVLVHVGFAMSVIDEEDAARTLEILAELGEAEEELSSMRNAGDPAAGADEARPEHAEEAGHEIHR